MGIPTTGESPQISSLLCIPIRTLLTGLLDNPEAWTDAVLQFTHCQFRMWTLILELFNTNKEVCGCIRAYYNDGKLSANPSSDASLFLKRNLLTPLSLWLVPLSYLVSFSFCSEEKRCQKIPFCFLPLFNLSVYPSWWSFLKSTDHQLSIVIGQYTHHALVKGTCSES